MKLARTVAALAVSSSLLLASCGGSGDSEGGSSDTPATDAPSAETTTTEAAAETTTTEATGAGATGDAVTIVDFAYDPTPLTVAVGTAVTFTNEDSAPHTATSTEAPVEFDTGDLAEGDADEITFDEAGTYEYYCSIHNYMKGEITVE